jgi:hypothetical protein
MAQGFKTGGRQKGSRNKKTVTLEKIGCEALAKTRAALELEPQIFDGDAHTLLMAIYRDMSRPDAGALGRSGWGADDLLLLDVRGLDPHDPGSSARPDEN